MAIVDHNLVTLGIHGRVGNLIFRRWGDRGVVSAAPVAGRRRWSKIQKENHDRFREAVVWTRGQMSDPVQRERFRRRAKAMQTAWNVAVSDYLLRPEVRVVDTGNYKGHAGDTIRVKMLRARHLKTLLVTILTAQGVVVESGEAKRLTDTNEWLYSCRRENRAVAGCSVAVQATGLRRAATTTRVTVQRK